MHGGITSLFILCIFECVVVRLLQNQMGSNDKNRVWVLNIRRFRDNNVRLQINREKVGEGGGRGDVVMWWWEVCAKNDLFFPCLASSSSYKTPCTTIHPFRSKISYKHGRWHQSTRSSNINGHNARSRYSLREGPRFWVSPRRHESRCSQAGASHLPQRTYTALV